MIKFLSDRCLSFNRGERDAKGTLITADAKIGFNELPDWVAGDPYYEICVKHNLIKPFAESSKSEDTQKDMEAAQALREEIRALEEKRDMLKTQAGAKTPEKPAVKVGTLNKSK